MTFLNRLLAIGKSEISDLLSKLEDSSKLIKQNINELENELVQVRKAFAEVKSISIQAQRSVEKYTQESQDWRNKATLLVSQAKKGLLQQQEADSFAMQALKEAQNTDLSAKKAKEEYLKQEKTVTSLNSQIQNMENMITNYKQELASLEARYKLAKVSKKIDQQFSDFDPNSTKTLLSKLSDRIDQEEALAMAYKESNHKEPQLNEKIDSLLQKTGDPQDDTLHQELEELKSKINS